MDITNTAQLSLLLEHYSNRYIASSRFNITRRACIHRPRASGNRQIPTAMRMKRFHALEKASTPCSCSRIRDTTSRKTSDDGQERFRLSNEACARILEETREKTSGEVTT